MDKRSRRRFTKEFKSETVALIRHSGKSIAEVCRDMGLPESSVHRWLAQAKIDSGQRDGLTTTERDPPRQGNYLLDRLFGATIHLIPAGPDPRIAVAPDEEARVREVVDSLRARGERPYVVPVGGSSGVGVGRSVIAGVVDGVRVEATPGALPRGPRRLIPLPTTSSPVTSPATLIVFPPEPPRI